jgi:nucleoside-diphosphate-sugar epimerase
VLGSFPDAEITWDIDQQRQSIVDSWPADVDATAARTDWGFSPRYDFDTAFSEYLTPRIREAYNK